VPRLAGNAGALARIPVKARGISGARSAGEGARVPSNQVEGLQVNAFTASK
jgi:hypothetical protein